MMGCQQLIQLFLSVFKVLLASKAFIMKRQLAQLMKNKTVLEMVDNL